MVEHFGDVYVLLGTDLHEDTVVLDRHEASLLTAHLPLSLEIAFVSDYYLRHVLYPMLFELRDPAFDVLERFAVIDGIGDYDARCAFEVGLCQISEAFLASSIPYLQLKFLLLVVLPRGNRNDLELEVNSNGGRMGYAVLFLDESEEDVGLADCRVADDDYFSEIVVLFLAEG